MNNIKILIKTIRNKTYYWIGDEEEWYFINDTQDVYLLLSDRLIDEQILHNALKLYDRYVALRLCMGKVVQDMDHNFWLPEELWMTIANIINEDIGNMIVHNNNSYNVKLTLKLLDKYKKDKERSEIEYL